MPADTSNAGDFGDRVVLVLPPPNAMLHAHNKGNRREKAPFVWSLRTLAKQQLSKVTKQQWEAANVEYWFYFPSHVRTDEVNAMQSQKPAIDGIVDAGFLPDDDWKHLHVAFVFCAVDKQNPRVELVFTRLKPQV